MGEEVMAVGTAPEGQRHTRVDDQLCFALYAASKAVTGVYRQLLSEFDLTYPQYLTMLAVWEQDGRTVAEIGQAVELDSGTLSPLLRRLERAGFIRRERTDPDERVVRIHVTANGRELERRVTPVRAAVEAGTGLTQDECVDLRETLHRLRRCVASQTPPERPASPASA
jgi:DNA-binding MarR family transcriptional regulator